MHTLMLYYRWHIGDFRKATRSLSALEKGLYREMLDEYYETEQPLPSHEETLFDALGVQSATEKAAVRKILQKKWVLTDKGFIQSRALAELLTQNEKRAKLAANGKMGGVARHKHLLDEKLAIARQSPANAELSLATLASHQPLATSHQPSAISHQPAPPGADVGTEVEFPEGFPKTADLAVKQLHNLALPDKPAEAWIREVWGQIVGRGFRDGADVPVRSFVHHANTRWTKEKQSWLAKQKLAGEKKEGAPVSSQNEKTVNPYEVPPCMEWKKIALALAEQHGADVGNLDELDWRDLAGEDRMAVWTEWKKEAGGPPA